MMLLGVFLHILLFSKKAIENRSVIEDYLISGAYFTFHTFRLPAFFVLAGYFAWLLIEKRGLNGFMRNRGKRLGLGLVFVGPLMGIATLFARGKTEVIADFEGVVRIGFLHLWFVYYLLIFCMLLFLFSQIRTSPRFSEFQARAGTWISDPRFLLFASLALMVAPDFLNRRAMIRISTSLIPDLPLLGFYALFFLCGVFLFRSGKAGLEALTKRAYVLCVVGMVSAQLAFGWGSNLTEGRLRDFLSIIASLFLAVGVIGLFLRLVKTSGKVLKYLVRTSYWVYIAHVPLVWLSLQLLDSLGLPPLLNIVISFFGVVALSFASFEMFVRRTPLSKLV